MTIRIKLGRTFSVGRTGPRVHLGSRSLNGSVGLGGWRLFARAGAFYGLWGGKK